ncbi:MAG: hypothetical protein V1908_01415 [Candidatus Peregrinibacteria bacterium]
MEKIKRALVLAMRHRIGFGDAPMTPEQFHLFKLGVEDTRNQLNEALRVARDLYPSDWRARMTASPEDSQVGEAALNLAADTATMLGGLHHPEYSFAPHGTSTLHSVQRFLSTQQFADKPGISRAVQEDLAGICLKIAVAPVVLFAPEQQRAFEIDFNRATLQLQTWWNKHTDMDLPGDMGDHYPKVIKIAKKLMLPWMTLAAEK